MKAKHEITISTVVQFCESNGELRTIIIDDIQKFETHTCYFGMNDLQKPFALVVFATKRG